MLKRYRNKVFQFILFAIVFFPAIAFSQQQDSVKKLPDAKWARVRKTDVKHIAIDLRFDWKKKQAYGTAEISFSPLSKTNTVSFDAAMLTIHSVSLVKGPVLKFQYDSSDKNDNLIIALDRVYNEQEDLTVKINYHTNWINETDPNSIWGSTGKGIRFFEPTSTEPRRRRQIWSMGEPESNRYWFPCYDDLNDFRTTSFTATVEKKFTVISNGNLVDQKDNNDGTHTFFYKTDMSHPNYKTGFIVGEYIDIKQNYEGVALHTFCYPDEKDAAIATVVRLPDMMKFFSESTGIKYPHDNYSQVSVQELPWGHGNAAMSLQTENMIDDYGTHADFFYLWDGLEVETLAQQWFGNYISCGDWSHAWLNRSFARYFAGLYSEYKNGKDEYLLYDHFTFDNSTYFSDWNAGVRHPIVTNNYDDVTSFATDNYSYFRGAMVLHMLRKQLGEGNWWKSIRYFLKSNANKPVKTEDFRRAVEETTGEPMDWFFDQWVYKMGHPIFEVDKRYDSLKKELHLSIRQTQKRDSSDLYPQAQFFMGKMDIGIDNKLEQVWIKPQEDNSYVFSLSKEPSLVKVDYESTWIKETVFKKSLNELLYQLQNDKDILGKRWAMGELVSLARNETISIADKNFIYEGLRNVILGNSYWRLKYAAILQLQSLLLPTDGKKAIIFDAPTIQMLLTTIKNERSWNRAAAIALLGLSKDKKYASLYLSYLNDESDRVINAAANALGKSKSQKAFKALVKLKDKPSWKNQSLISTLNGLKELGDIRGVEIALTALKDASAAPRWTLATPVWDFRIAAAETIVALGSVAAGYEIVYDKFKKSIAENNVNDIFNNVLLVAVLGDAKGKEVFDQLKEKYKNDANALIVVSQYEEQFQSMLKTNNK